MIPLLLVSMPESRSPRGERGLKYLIAFEPIPWCCRSPRGERGLKSKSSAAGQGREVSLPPRGVWIEILVIRDPTVSIRCRSPRGERGLKSAVIAHVPLLGTVAPPAGSVD